MRQDHHTLLKRLRSPQPEVAESAVLDLQYQHLPREFATPYAEALANIATSKEFCQLNEATYDWWWTGALEHLDRLGDAGIKALLDLVHDKDPEIAETAIMALVGPLHDGDFAGDYLLPISRNEERRILRATECLLALHLSGTRTSSVGLQNIVDYIRQWGIRDKHPRALD